MTFLDAVYPQTIAYTHIKSITLGGLGHLI